MNISPCPHCHGAGRTGPYEDDDACRVCAGTGRVCRDPVVPSPPATMPRIARFEDVDDVYAATALTAEPDDLTFPQVCAR